MFSFYWGSSPLYLLQKCNPCNNIYIFHFLSVISIYVANVDKLRKNKMLHGNIIK